jgi:hypothetical protein
MVTNSTFITVVVSLAAVSISSMTLVAKQLGDRITDLGRVSGERLSGVESGLGQRMGSLEVRLNALEGAMRDVGEGLTVLETDFGKH